MKRKIKESDDVSLLFSTEIHPLELLQGFSLPKIQPMELNSDNDEDYTVDQSDGAQILKKIAQSLQVNSEYPNSEPKNTEIDSAENTPNVKTPKNNPILISPTLIDINNGQVIEHIILEKNTKIGSKIYPRGSIIRVVKYGQI